MRKTFVDSLVLMGISEHLASRLLSSEGASTESIMDKFSLLSERIGLAKKVIDGYPDVQISLDKVIGAEIVSLGFIKSPETSQAVGITTVVREIDNTPNEYLVIYTPKDTSSKIRIAEYVPVDADNQEHREVSLETEEGLFVCVSFIAGLSGVILTKEVYEDRLSIQEAISCLPSPAAIQASSGSNESSLGYPG